MPDGPPQADEELTEADLGMAATPGPDEPAHRRAILVTGTGPSGASLMSGILKHIGLTVPEPAVLAHGNSPEGFDEPQWVVDFHDELLRRTIVQPSDARPSAWFDTGRACTREGNRAELAEWLGTQFAVGDSLVIKDPRVVWFLPLWRVAAVRLAASTSTITMLRPPPEVVGTDSADDGGRLGDIGRLAGWTNVMLGGERATRRTPRAFVRHHDLLADWTRTVVRVGEELQIEEIIHAEVGRMQQVHGFVDPQLQRVRASWDDLDVPDSLREVARETWETLNQLAEPGSDGSELHTTLDQLRRAYAAQYLEAEAFARSSVEAAGPTFVRETRRARAAQAESTVRAVHDAASPARKAYLRTRRAGGRVKRRLQGRA